MWHIGTDSLSEYAGERFEMTWENGENALLRIYTKDMNRGNENKIRIRKEHQEYPRIRLDAAINEKLQALGWNERWDEHNEKWQPVLTGALSYPDLAKIPNVNVL